MKYMNNSNFEVRGNFTEVETLQEIFSFCELVTLPLDLTQECFEDELSVGLIIRDIIGVQLVPKQA